MNIDPKKEPVDKNAFAKIFNDVEAYPALRDVALKLGVSVQTIKNRAGRMKRAHDRGKDAPYLVSRVTPMSESEFKLHADWTEEDCITELLRIAELDPERFLTRNYFRNESQVSEATWTRYFGSFAEFKKQAGITPPRAIKKLEREIGKHVSLDHYRRLSEERMAYGDRYNYEKGSKGQWKTILVGSDLHDVECDRFWLRAFLEAARRVQPDVICLNGDIFDIPEFGKYYVDPRTWDVVGRIKFVHEQILGPLREACPNTTIDLIEGNHEFRLVKHMCDQSPAMMTVLSDLHGMTVSKLFGLDRFEVNYLAKAELAAFNVNDIKRELQRNYKIYWDCLLAHHFPQGMQMQMPGWNGHCHSHKVWSHYSPTFGSYEWQQIGAGHVREATYCAGEKWSNGFAIVHCNTITKRSVFDYVSVGDVAVLGGVFMERREGE